MCQEYNLFNFLQADIRCLTTYSDEIIVDTDFCVQSNKILKQKKREREQDIHSSAERFIIKKL